MADRTGTEQAGIGIPWREIVDRDPQRGVLVFDADLRLVYVNGAARRSVSDDGAVTFAQARVAVGAYRDRTRRGDREEPPEDLTLGGPGGNGLAAAISRINLPMGRWYVVRIGGGVIYGPPSVRGLQSRFRLTKREAEVAVGVSRGHTNAEIAHELGITEKTVKNALMAVFGKCNVRNRVELALRSYDLPVESSPPGLGVAPADAV